MRKKVIIFDATGSLKDIGYSLKGAIYVRSDSVGFHAGFKKKFLNKLKKGTSFLMSVFSERILLSDTVTSIQLKIADEFIFLNHGWGTKLTPPKWKWNDPKSYSHFKRMIEMDSKIICLSDFDSTYFLKAPGLNPSKDMFVPLGHPRNDYLVRNSGNTSIRENILSKLGIPYDHRIILYAPTHREFKDVNEKAYERILSELEDIDKILRETDVYLLFRPHYYMEGMDRVFKDMERIKYVGVDVFNDVRDLMIASDILVTDYSSIYVDFLLLEKPIIFYPFDIEDYENLRGLAVDFSNPVHTPGPKIKKLVEIVDVLDDLKSYREYLLKAKVHFHKFHDDKSTERVVDFVMNLLEG